MAEICFSCLNDLENNKYKENMFIISRDLELCEECGQYKRVVIRMKRRYVFKENLQEWIKDMQTLYGRNRKG